MAIHEGAQDAAPAQAWQAVCSGCAKPQPACVCDRLQAVAGGRPVLVLQHPREQDDVLSTTPLLLACLPAARRAIGLSWASLPQALAAAGLGGRGAAPDPTAWAVCYPASLPRGVAAAGGAVEQLRLMDGRGRPLPPHRAQGLVLLDGTWSQAKALWWRNPWLCRLPRLVLSPPQPSLYGRLRRQPQRHCLSTLEAVAAAYDGLREAPEAGQVLRRAMRTFAQRLRAAPVGAVVAAPAAGAAARGPAPMAMAVGPC